MNIRKLPKEELELLSYTDIAYELLKHDKKPKTTPVLFKEVCTLLNINEDNMMEMIGDFYTNLTTDKRFLLLDKAEWDLKEAHIVKPILDEEDEEDMQEESEEEEASEVDYDSEDEEDEEEYDLDDPEEDDLEDLAIISEEEMDE